MLRHYGQQEPHQHHRLDELQAAVVRTRLPYLTRWTARRRDIAKRNQAEFKHPGVRILPPPQESSRHVYYLFVITCSDRGALQRHLKANGVEPLIHYPVPPHKQEPCRSLPQDPMGLTHSDQHSRVCFCSVSSLPL
jgi:dTDP-4-amino-4,6-dideoxygalactose transaminase